MVTVSKTKLGRTAYSQIVISIVALLAFTACGQKESRLVTKAPTTDAETGFAIKGEHLSKDKVLQFAQDFNAKFRVVNANHNLYEIYDADKQTIEAELKPSSLFKNKVKFYGEKATSTSNKMLALTKQLNNLKSLADEDEEPEVLIDCNSDATEEEQAEAPKPYFVVSHKDIAEPASSEDGALSLFLPSPEESLNFELKVNSESETAHYIIGIANPRFSGRESMQVEDLSFEFQPEMAGGYTIFAAAQNADGEACGYTTVEVLVTANPELKDVDPVTTDIELSKFLHLTQIDAISARGLASDDEVLVAVLDSGIDYNHPLLQNQIAYNEGEIPDNGIDDDGNGIVDDYIGVDYAHGDILPYDDSGHGTHVSGLIAAEQTGVAQNARIIPVKVLSGMSGDAASSIGGLYYSIDRGAKIVNMSLGRYKMDTTDFSFEDLEQLEQLENAQKAAISFAEEQGVLIIAAAGNGDEMGLPVDTDANSHFPSSFENENILSVTSVNIIDTLVDYANFGETTVDIAAPGGDKVLPLISTVPSNPVGMPFGGADGTSMATPVTSGVAALLLSQYPDLKPNEIKLVLMESGSFNSELDGMIVSGSVINAEAALEDAEMILNTMSDQDAEEDDGEQSLRDFLGSLF